MAIENPFPEGDDAKQFARLVQILPANYEVIKHVELQVEWYHEYVQFAFESPIEPGQKFKLAGMARDLLFAYLNAVSYLPDEYQPG